VGDRTIHNHVSRINTLLKSYGVVNLLSAADWPKYDEKDVTAHNSDELASLFAASSSEERILFEFFLSTGFREQKTMYCPWANVDLKKQGDLGLVEAGIGFRAKDKEERSVPVPDSLIEALAERKRLAPSLLIFPGKSW
jgi:integrase/recombinase XerD